MILTPDAESDSRFRLVARRAMLAGVALAGRQALVFALNAVGALVLARLLPARIFGVYAVVLFVQNACVVLADAGLGASLIRREAEPTAAELSLVAWVQAAFALAVLAVAACIWPFLPTTADDLGVPTLVLLLPAGLLFTVVQTPVLIQLERSLRFTSIGIVNVIQTLVFNVIAVAAAANNANGSAFAYAFVAQALTAAILMLWIGRWTPSRPAPLTHLRPMLQFGIPYQASTLLSLIKDFASPAVVGVLIGAAGVGRVEWANNLAAYALIALMVMQRVYLPAFARLQDDPAALGRAVSGAIRVANAVVAPVAVLTLVLAPDITDVVFGHRWHVALKAFWWLWAANIIVPTVSPLYGLLNAVGMSRTTLRFTALWLALTWVLSIPLVHWFGIAGFGIANLGVQITNFWLIHIARRVAPFSPWRAAIEPWLAAVLMGSACLALSFAVNPNTIARLVAELAAGLLLYVFVMAVWQRRWMRQVLALMKG